MPNHVHVVIEVVENWTLAKIAHSWKSFTAGEVNAVLERRGRLWQREYFDRFIRDERHLFRAIEYVDWNPVKAGFCRRPEDWRFSSAWRARNAKR